MSVDTKPLPDASLAAIAPEVAAWMAGLLEGEGYFFFNASKRLGVRLVMTDRDVVQRFADAWEVRYWTLKKRKDHQKTPFCVALPGPKAAQCMQLVLPHSGLRRSQVIRESLAAYETRFSARGGCRKGHGAKFSDAELASVWLGRTPGTSFRAFCGEHSLANRTSVKNRLTRMGLVAGAPAIATAAPLPEVEPLVEQSETIRTTWLAGLLEGEGSFRCLNGCPRVALQMTDEDVVAVYASLVGGSYRGQSAARAHWKPTFVCEVYGDRAASIMEHILPWMGERRSAKIRECLAARAESQARLAAQQSAHASAREAKLPAAELTTRWTARAAGETLSTFARKYGVHPQIMKNRLVELGVYASPVYKCRTDVTYTCASCHTPFVRKAAQRGGQYCSRVCSGRAAQQRRKKLLATAGGLGSRTAP